MICNIDPHVQKHAVQHRHRYVPYTYIMYYWSPSIRTIIVIRLYAQTLVISYFLKTYTQEITLLF